MQIVPQTDPVSGEEITVHLILDDAGGDSAVVEHVDGRPQIHHDRSFNVVTNSPTFDERLENLGHFEGFGGEAPLPGTTEAADRFVRAAYYLQRLPEPRSDREAVAEILSVMRNTSQPFGTADPDRPNITPTIWRTVSHLTAGLYFFESAFDPNIVWIQVADVDLSAGASALKLNLRGDDSDLVGDLTSRFQPTDPVEVAYLKGTPVTNHTANRSTRRRRRRIPRFETVNVAFDNSGGVISRVRTRSANRRAAPAMSISDRLSASLIAGTMMA